MTRSWYEERRAYTHLQEQMFIYLLVEDCTSFLDRGQASALETSMMSPSKRRTHDGMKSLVCALAEHVVQGIHVSTVKF